MTQYWTEPKDPSDVDYYEIEIDAAWLGAETIATATVEPVAEAGITLGGLGVQANVVRALFSGGNIGTWGVEVTVTTSAGRIRQSTVYLVVKEK